MITEKQTARLEAAIAERTAGVIRCVTHLAVMFNEVPKVCVRQAYTEVAFGEADVTLFLCDDGALRLEFGPDCHNPGPDRKALCEWAEREQLECPWLA